MKIIYDEAKAIARKKQFEQEVEETNLKIHKKNTIITVFVWSIATILGVASIIVFYPFLTDMLASVAEDDGVSRVIFLGCYVGAPVTFFIFASLIVSATTEGYRSCKFSQDVLYYIATHDLSTRQKNILRVDFKPAAKADNVEIELIYEDENHIIFRQDVCWLTCKQSTAVTEASADLENGLCLVPYKEYKG